MTIIMLRNQSYGICKRIFRLYSSTTTSNFTCGKVVQVPMFCNLIINLPCSIKIKHLDLHQNNHDILMIKATNPSGGETGEITHLIDGSDIFLEGNKLGNDVVCEIEAPIKCNLNVTSEKDIHVESFDSNYLKLNSGGNISVNKFIGESFEVTTHTGNITFNNVIQAKIIRAAVSQYGSIRTGRLQGIDLSLSTKNGDIMVDSSYCDKSEFSLNKGNMNLSNAHKDCKVSVYDSGSINMTGFDGKLLLYLRTGLCDIQLSQILEDSEIFVQEDGRLTLRLSEECQLETSLSIKAKDTLVDANVKLVRSAVDRTVYLTSPSDTSKDIAVTCENGSVEVKSASWADMLFHKINKKG